MSFFTADDVSLEGVRTPETEPGASWLVFRIDCGLARPGLLLVLEDAVRDAGLEQEPGLVRAALAWRLNVLARDRGPVAVVDLLHDDAGLRLRQLSPADRTS